MKLVTAVVKSDKLDDVVQAVSEVGARGLTATEVRGFGEQYGHESQHLPADVGVLVLPKLRIDVPMASPSRSASPRSSTGTMRARCRSS
jgi:nitrogen regulatory protein P-II 2